MNPVQNAPGAQYTPFAAIAQLGPLVSVPAGNGGTSTAGTADGVVGCNMPFGGTTGDRTTKESSNAIDPNSASAAGPGQPGGFFAVLQNIMDQLDTMIGQLLGTPVSGGGTPGPVPVDGPIAAPPTGAPIAAPAARQPL